MADTASGFVYQADVALFRAVHYIPFAKLKDIILTHYGDQHFDTEWRRIRGARQGSASGNNNLCLYLSITNRLGRKDGAIAEIMGAYRDITGMDSTNKSRGDTLASQQQTQTLVVEPTDADPSVRDNVTIEAAESVIMDLNLEDTMSDYLEAFKCNTTLSCCLEIGDVDCYGSEVCSDSDEDSEHEESDSCCSDEGDEGDDDDDDWQCSSSYEPARDDSKDRCDSDKYCEHHERYRRCSDGDDEDERQQCSCSSSLSEPVRDGSKDSCDSDADSEHDDESYRRCSDGDELQQCSCSCSSSLSEPARDSEHDESDSSSRTTTQGDEDWGGYVLEDETVAKPKVIIMEDE